MRNGYALAAAAACACGAKPAPVVPLYAAGDHHDDGAGLLARASAPWLTSRGSGDDAEDDDDDPSARAQALDDVLASAAAPDGGDAYGGWLYGGLANGALSYGAAFADPGPMYEPIDGLSGTIEGVVSWAGALPPRVTTACGALANPTARVGADRKVGGALVFVSSELATGRPWPMATKPMTIGGTITKRGCRLLPAAQIVAPAPMTVEVNGDASAASFHAFDTASASASTTPSAAIMLAAGGIAHVGIGLGITRIDSDDHRVSPAWLVGVITPYYAITDDGGRFRIDELPPGTYEFTIWQAPVATGVAGGALVYGEPLVVKRTVQIGAKPTRLDVAIGPGVK